MSSTTTSPAPARDDVRGAAGVPDARQGRKDRRAEVLAARAAALPPVSTRSARQVGAAVAVGAVVWSAATFAVTPNPESSVGIMISDIGALPFQASLFALITLQLRTRATGLGRGAVALLRVEYVLLTLATLWTVVHALVPAARDDLWLGVLDAFWPLSMLGMAVIGVKVALAGRWRGLVRAWPLVAESWGPVSVTAFVLSGGALWWVGGAHLLVGYLVLGLLLLTRPELTGARDL